jgi:hypothetical protein
VAKGRQRERASGGPLSGPGLDDPSTQPGSAAPPAPAPAEGPRRRGRPALAASDRRTYRLNVALPPDALQQLEQRARIHGERPSTYAGRVVLERLAAFELLPQPTEGVRSQLHGAGEQLNRVMHELHLADLQAPEHALEGAGAPRLASALGTLAAALRRARAEEQP